MIGILLATYEPDRLFFEAQIKSIKQQDYSNWICHIFDDASSPKTQERIKALIDDDPRFISHFHLQNLGSYRNFERGLSFLQNNKKLTYIAFADQDDIWHTNKLSTLHKKLVETQATLIHSDLELIDYQNKILCSSVWEHENRYPEKMDVNLLLLRNTVTGCSILFHRSLLTDVLPFPKQKKIGDWYHDHWIAIVAAHKGTIVHFRQPLVKYRQHENNTVGAQKNTGSIRLEFTLLLLKKGRLTFKSYRVRSDLSHAFHKRFSSDFKNSNKNVFFDDNLDFGLRILKLGIYSFLKGYGSQGIALRLIAHKFIFDLSKLSNLFAPNRKTKY